MKVEDILKTLVAFNTVEDKENKKIIFWLEAFLKKKGFVTEKIKDRETGKINLFASLANKSAKGIVFVGHTDTVPASSLWKYDPFKLTQAGDKLFGLGTSDMKGGIAALLAAIEQTDLKKLKNGVSVIFTFDEEKTFEGIKNFIKKKKISKSKIIIAEPTDCRPIVATKGVAAFRMEFFGKAAHGSVPDEGKNAIKATCSFLAQLEKIGKRLERGKNNIFNPSCATLNVGKIQGGDAINKVPDKCFVEFEFRTIKNGQGDCIIKEIKDLLKKRKIKAELAVLINMDPLINEKGGLAELAGSITKKELTGANYMTEGSFLAGNGNEIIILGPGPVNAHKADEYVSKKSLYKTTEIYKKMIEDICF